MPIPGCLSEDWFHKIELKSQRTWPHVEIMEHDAFELLGTLNSRAVGVYEDADWLHNSNCIRDLDRTPARERRGNNGLCNPSRKVCPTTVDLSRLWSVRILK